jgi:peptidoglycan-associated lipoprotein
MKTLKTLTILLAAASLLAGYACRAKPVHVPLSERAAQQQPGGDAGTIGQKPDTSISEEELARREAERRRRAAEEAMRASRLQDIDFEFDSYNIRQEDVPVLQDLAVRLSQNQDARLLIEGHCDERGTTDYNLVLGQKRADVVKDYLVKAGVSENRLKALSYGKEVPLDPGHTEDAWAKNRRAHFVLQ